MPTPTPVTVARRSSSSATWPAAAAIPSRVADAVGCCARCSRRPSPNTAPTAIFVPPTSTPIAADSATGREVRRRDAEEQAHGLVRHVEELVRDAPGHDEAVAGLDL